MLIRSGESLFIVSKMIERLYFFKPVYYGQISQTPWQLKAIVSYISVPLNLRKTVKYETCSPYKTLELFKFNGAQDGVEKQHKLCHFWPPVENRLSQ